MFGPTYSIANWDEQFENASSRKLKVLGWVPIPNGHDSTAYCRLMNRKDGPEIFTAWILLVQLASRCHDRGVLASNDGRPYQASEIALKTRAPEKLFIKGLPELVAMGWVDAEGELGESANASGESANASGGRGRIAAGNRTEEKEQNRRELPTPEPVAKEFQVIKRWREIYNCYPRKVSPVAAEKAIRKAINIKGFTYLREAVVAYAKAVKAVDKKFIPYPASWFNAGCYDDDRSEWGTNSDNYQKPGNNSADSIIKELQKQTDRL
tara:strand:+ start:266 stop:1066 length:801 start_codon:yes stop_codon:yes gene_type:complete